MNLKQLTYFLTIVDEGNITAAAKRLHISQPPLSNQLKLLEESLGVKLMERGARNITLTEAGKLLYAKGQNIINMADATVREIEDFAKGVQGSLSLGTISSSGAVLLQKRLINFNKRYPKVRFHIHEGNTFELLELLNSGVIEVAVVRLPFNMEKYNGIFLDEEPMVAIMNKRLDWNKEQMTCSLKELENKPIILYRRLKKVIVSACIEEGFEPDIFCENDDARTTVLWAEAGLGVGIIPETALNIIKSDELIHKTIDNVNIHSRIGVIWLKDRYLSSIAKSFIDIFKETNKGEDK